MKYLRGKMSFIKVSGYIRIRAVNVILPGLRGIDERAIWLVGGSEKPPHDQAPVF